MQFTVGMRKKLIVLFTGITVLMCALIGRLMYIEYNNGEKYKKKVLSMQSYDSVTIKYQRGDITDRTGTVFATSVAVYNVVLDCSVLTSKKEYIQPTIDALLSCFPDLERDTLESYVEKEKDNPYIVLFKKLPYEQIQEFSNLMAEVDDNGDLVHPNIKGVWFEKEYERYYPNGKLAASVVGFASSGNSGTVGLEYQYNQVLNGSDGRAYGYLNADNDFEKTVIDAKDGCNLVTTIDANLQSIAENKISEFVEAYRDNYYYGAGASNVGVIIMDPNNGEVLAMANYPNFDLSNPRDLSAYYTQEQIESMNDKETYDAMNKIWTNFCVSATYEPGSVQKPLTVAAGIETGTITESMTFNCDGYEEFGGNRVHCFLRSGHGMETVEGALMDSCNDALMQMSYLIGAEKFLQYQKIFGFWKKTGIDLPGEASAAGLGFTLDNITPVDLATNSFGQNYNCSMIQMASAYCSLVNGGNYYKPHVVKKITDSTGNTVSEFSPLLVKQTVSESTSDLLKSYMYRTVSEGGATYAKVDGYSMGGKTGTAQKLPRALENYVASFMGFAPVENPQLVIYCVIDEPNVEHQDHSMFAMNLAREILEEALPYMNIYPDEETTGINAGVDVTGGNYLISEVKNPIEKPTSVEQVENPEE